jgi:hypothetical protein
LPLDRLIWRRCQIVARVLAEDLDDLDEAEGGPQPAEGRELFIVDLRNPTMMPRPWLCIGRLSWRAPAGPDI